MKTRLIVLSILLVSSIVSIIAVAQDNDPRVNPEANSCFEGGILAGVCDTTDVDNDGDTDSFDSAWAWRCGWYHIRVEYGIYPEEILNGVCKDIPVVIVEEENKKDKKKKKKTVIEEPEEEEEEVPE